MSTTDEDRGLNGREAAASGINQLFAACDLDGSGFIEREELRAICNELSGEELSDVFRQLDSDGDGKISIAEFAEGFHAMRDTLVNISITKERHQSLQPDERVRRVSSRLDWKSNSKEWSSTDQELLLDGDNRQKRERRKSLFDLVGSLDEGFTAITCQEQICELYQHLHDAGYHDQLSKFEDIIVSVIKDVRKQQCENERLERSYQREKESHARHLRHLEEDMEGQMQKVEQRVRKEEKEKFDAMKEEYLLQHEAEIDELQVNLNRLQTLDVPISFEKPTDDIKVRLDELMQENRALKRTVNDTQTSLALQRSEVATLRVQLEEKYYELETEKQTLVEYMKEHDNLTRQIHMLHDANKNLQDTNDDLREALETTRSAFKRPHSLRQRIRRPSFISQHLSGRSSKMLRSLSAGSRGEYVRRYLQDSTTTPEGAENCTSQSTPMQPDTASLADELAMFDDISQRQQPRTLLPAQDSCETDSIPEDDSGHFTMREVHDEYSDDESISTPKKRNRASARRTMYRTSSALGSQMVSSFETQCSSLPGGPAGSSAARYCTDTDSICPSGPMDDIDVFSTIAPSVTCSMCSHSTGGASGGHHFDSTRRNNSMLMNPQQKPITQDPERIFKIVLAGDAAVGKSSFIMRLCKNKFVTNLNSTLGVDFQTKTLEIDGRVIALQLWDTAGQERFRSIAKSYFRRADGVLLLYDVTYERSFLNVRDWMEAIEEGAQKQIPIMLVGNKCDLRIEQSDLPRNYVKLEDGQRLAREFQGLFIESSAKDGRNVTEAVTELSRMLMTNEDLEVQSVGLKLQDVTETSKKRSACCNL